MGFSVSNVLLADGIPTVVVAPPCSLADPGWAIVHKVEADANNHDKFAKNTCEVLGDLASLFIPSGAGAQNNVHIFFPAGVVQGDVNNGVVTHALRAAANANNWILIAVRSAFADADGIVHRVTKISARQVIDLLKAHGRPDRIDKLRLSSHSRGSFNLKATLDGKLLVAKGAADPVVPPDKVDRVISFDSDSNHFMTAVKGAGIDPGVVFGYWATVFPDTAPFVRSRVWTIPDSQTIDLGTDPIVKIGLRAVEYGRLVDDATTLRPDIVRTFTAASPDIVRNLQSLKLPAAGGFTSVGGQFQSFCRTNSAVTEILVGPEVRNTKNSDLWKFIDSNDLARVGHTGISPGIWHHHLLVAEFGHEMTDPAPPQPG